MLHIYLPILSALTLVKQEGKRINKRADTKILISKLPSFLHPYRYWEKYNNYISLSDETDRWPVLVLLQVFLMFCS